MGPAYLQKDRQGGREKGHLSCGLTLLSMLPWQQQSVPASRLLQHLWTCSVCPLTSAGCGWAVPPPQGCFPDGLIGGWVASNQCPRLGACSLSMCFIPAKYSCEASSHPCCWVARRALWALSGSGPFPGGIYTLCSHSRTEHSLVALLGVVPAGQGQRRLYLIPLQKLGRVQHSLGSRSLHTKTPLSSSSW